MEQTTKNPVKKALSTIKTKYFPTPQQMVDNMKKSTSYPNGKAYWSIASKIVKSKTIEPTEKVNLLLDLYGKYYIYQQKNCVTFAVYENYYEEFIFPQPNGKVYRHKARFDKLYNELEAENSYIINRSLRDNLDKVITQATPPGTSRIAFVESLDEKAKSITYLTRGLPNDFFEDGKKVFGVYISSKEEDYVKDLLCERFYETHPEHIQETTTEEPFKEIVSASANPYLPQPAIPTAVKEGAIAIMEKAGELKDVTTDAIKSVSQDKLPEQ